jgi:hypothetical protein
MGPGILKRKTRAGAIFSMAVIPVLCIAVILTLCSCITITVNSSAGSGKITNRSYDVSDFSRLSFSGIGKIIIKQGDREGLSVEAESNVIDNIKVNKVGNILEIGFKNSFFKVIPTKDIVFNLTVKNLEEVTISGAGSIECDSLQTQSLSIVSSGAGNVVLGITATNLEINISGAGKVNASGTVKTQSLDISGAGSYNAKDLISDNCEINISGAGKAVVRVNEALDVKISGFGNVEYYGSPSVTQNVSGVGGSVNKLD